MHMIYFRSGDSMMSVLLISGRQMASVFQKNLIGICEPQINTSAAPINTYVNTHTHTHTHTHMFVSLYFHCFYIR